MSSDLLAASQDFTKCSEAVERAAAERLALGGTGKAPRADIEFALSVVNQANQQISKRAAEIRAQVERSDGQIDMLCVERTIRVALAAFRFLHEHRSQAGFSVLSLEKTLSNYTIACTNAHLGPRIWDALMLLRRLLLEHAKTHTAGDAGSTATSTSSRSVRKPASRAKRGSGRQQQQPRAQGRPNAANLTRGMNRLSISGASEPVAQTHFPIEHCQNSLSFNLLVVTLLSNVLRVLAQAPSSELALKSLVGLATRAHSALDWCLRFRDLDKNSVDPFLSVCFRAYYTLGGISNTHSLDIRLLAIHAYSQTKKCDIRELLKYASRAAVRVESALAAGSDQIAASRSIDAYYTRVLALTHTKIATVAVSPELVEFCHHLAQVRQRQGDMQKSLAACRLVSGSDAAKLVSGMLSIECLTRLSIGGDRIQPEIEQLRDGLGPLVDATLHVSARHTLAEWNALALSADIARKSARSAQSELKQGRASAVSLGVSVTLVAMLDAASAIYGAYISRGAAAKAEGAGGTNMSVLYNHSAEVSLLLLQLALQYSESDVGAQTHASNHSDRLLSMCANKQCNPDYLRNHSTVYFNRGAGLYQLKLYAQAAAAVELSIRSMSQWIAQATQDSLGNALEQLCKRFEVAALAYQYNHAFTEAASMYGRAVSWIVCEHSGEEITTAISFGSGQSEDSLPPASSECLKSVAATWLLQFVDRYVRMCAGRLVRDPSEPQALISVQEYMPTQLENRMLRGWLYEAESQFWQPLVTPTTKYVLAVQQAHLQRALDCYGDSAPLGHARCLVELAKVDRDSGEIEQCRDRLHAAMEVTKSRYRDSVYVLGVLAESYAWQAVVQIEHEGQATEAIGACARLWALMLQRASADNILLDSGYMRGVVGLMQQVAELLMSRRLYTLATELLQTAFRISDLCEQSDRSWASVAMSCLVTLGSSSLLCGNSGTAAEYFSNAASRYEPGVLPVHVEVSAKIAYASFQLACGDVAGGAETMQGAGELARNSLDAVISLARPTSKRKDAASPETLVLLSRAAHAYSQLALKQGTLADAIDLGIHSYRILNSLLKSLSVAHQRAMKEQLRSSERVEDDPFADPQPNAADADADAEGKDESEFIAFGGNWELQRLLIDVLAHLADVYSVRGSTKEVDYFVKKALDLSAQLHAPFQQDRVRLIEADVLSRKSLWDECAAALQKLRERTDADSATLMGCGVADAVNSLVVEGDSWRRCENYARAQTAYTQAQQLLKRMSDTDVVAEAQTLAGQAEVTPRLQRILSQIESDTISCPDTKNSGSALPAPVSIMHEDVAIRQQLIAALGDLADDAASRQNAISPATRSIDRQPDHLLLQCKLMFVELRRMLGQDEASSSVLQSTLMFPALQQPRSQKPRKGSTKAQIRDLLHDLDERLLESIEVAIAVGSAHTVHESSHLLVLVRAMRSAFGLAAVSAMDLANIVDDCRNVTVVREAVDAMRRRHERVPAKLTLWPEEIVSHAAADVDNGRAASSGDGSPVLRARGRQAQRAPARSLAGLSLAGSSTGNDLLSVADAQLQHAIDGKQVVAGWSADDTETSAQQLSSELPPNWTVCGLSIDQARDVLFITRYGRDQEPIVLSLPMRAIDSESFDKPDMSSKSVFDGAYQQLRLIIAESDATMKSGGACATEAEKRAWWERRAALDQQLGELLGSIEDEWLGAFRHVLDPTVRFSASDGQRLRKSIGQCLVKSLPKTFAAKARTMELATEVCMLVARVLQKATDAEDDGNDWLDVCSLIWDTYVFQGAAPPSDDDTLRAFSEQLREAVQEYVGVFGEAEGGEHLILVLDKHSQQIPWECLPCIRDVPISRMPSVAFLRQRIAAMRHGNSRLDSPSSSELSLSSLAQRSSYSRGRALTPEPGSGPSLLSSLAFDDCVPDTKRNSSNGMAGASVSGRRVFYVLNPEGDLHRTQSNFEAHLQGQREWSGVVGRRPMNSECEHALQSSDIFLYFGHGGGERYVSRTQIRALDRCAVALLLGCSSGQLSLAGEFDALGTATDYMVGGCPALLGNLWDVGDKDIDRFAASLLQIWGLASHSPAPIAVNIDTEHCQRLSNAPTSLAEAVCWARKACRMSFLTGAAPVVYGVPVYLM